LDAGSGDSRTSRETASCLAQRPMTGWLQRTDDITHHPRLLLYDPRLHAPKFSKPVVTARVAHAADEAAESAQNPGRQAAVSALT
jgi:hypothetical protein